MDTFIDKLCLKRLCLPSNTDINLLRNGIIKYNSCACDTSKHVAACFKEKQYFKCVKLWNKYV